MKIVLIVAGAVIGALLIIFLLVRVAAAGLGNVWRQWSDRESGHCGS